MLIWKPNTTIQNGRFLIKKILGAGGFGITYLAQETAKERQVVIKTLNAARQNAEDFREVQVKFVNEALKLSQFRHPQIVRVQEVIQEGDLWGMVMEYIDGMELSDYLLERGQIPEAEALGYIDQIAQALDYVHQQGVLHRDVKPNNIMLRSGNREAILIDFGLARDFIDGKSLSMTSSRTEGYAPPEQYERQGKFAAYTDVYALAATLYHLLTGHIPIPAYFREHNVNLPEPKEHNPAISSRVNRAILQGMAMDATQRPKNTTEFRKLLGLIPDLSPPDRLQSKIERGRMFLLLSILAASGVGIHAMWTTISSSSNRQPIDRPAVDNSTSTPILTTSTAPRQQIAELVQARLFVKPGDATSRYQAILAARKIPPTTPAAATEVQEAIEQWSQEIYQIAKGYADRQYWQLAIDTAKMVPKDATNYTAIQAVMSQWRSKLPG